MGKSGKFWEKDVSPCEQEENTGNFRAKFSGKLRRNISGTFVQISGLFFRNFVLNQQKGTVNLVDQARLDRPLLDG